MAYDKNIDTSQGKFRTPLSSEDGRTYNRTWADRGLPTSSCSQVSQEHWDNIFGKKNKENKK